MKEGLQRSLALRSDKKGRQEFSSEYESIHHPSWGTDHAIRKPEKAILGNVQWGILRFFRKNLDLIMSNCHRLCHDSIYRKPRNGHVSCLDFSCSPKCIQYNSFSQSKHHHKIPQPSHETHNRVGHINSHISYPGSSHWCVENCTSMDGDRALIPWRIAHAFWTLFHPGHNLLAITMARFQIC